MSKDWFTDDDVADVIAVITSAPSDKTLVEIVQATLRAVNPFEWQPIETVPDELMRGPDFFTRILLLVPPYGAGSGNWDDARWNCHFCLNKEAQPTHWMLLPPAPEGE